MVTDAKSQANQKMLEKYAGAWNSHDLDAIMSAMTDDCVFVTNSGGDGFGVQVTGQNDVRAGFAGFFQAYPDVQFNDALICVSGDDGILEATQSRTESDGSKTIHRGCDVLKFRDGKIAVKSYYIKT